MRKSEETIATTPLGTRFHKILFGGASLNSRWNTNSDSPKVTDLQAPPFPPDNTVNAPTLQFLLAWIKKGRK